MDNAISAKLISQATVSVKQLEGFQKHHRVPASASPGDLRFIQELALPELDRDLQDVFSALRKAYGLKRKELSVDGPFDGGGIITTPFFCYQIQVSQLADSPSRISWDRAITEISEPARVFAGPFEQVFGKQFSALEITVQEPLDLEAIVDHIEDLENQSIQIDYDKDLTWCEFGIEDSKTKVQITEDLIKVNSGIEISPQELLEEFLEIQHLIAESLDLSSIPFLSSR